MANVTEKPFTLDLDKTREIATRINSASPTPSQSERVHIEGAIWYATIYADHRLEEFIEMWNETADYQNRPDLLWEKLDDDQRHEALVVNADNHFTADLDLPDRFDRRMTDEMTLI